MPCYQSTNLPSGVTTSGRTAYTTQADCLQACKEGACCEGTTCSVKPQCQCQGTGKTFKGVGTTCTPNPCLCYCLDGLTPLPTSVTAVVFVQYIAGFYFAVGSNAQPWQATYSLQLASCLQYRAIIATPLPFSNFSSFFVSETTTLTLDIDTGLFSILPTLAPGQVRNVDYYNGRWVVSGAIASIICTGGSAKKYWAEDAGYRSAYVEIIANPLQ